MSLCNQSQLHIPLAPLRERLAAPYAARDLKAIHYGGSGCARKILIGESAASVGIKRSAVNAVGHFAFEHDLGLDRARTCIPKPANHLELSSFPFSSRHASLTSPTRFSAV